jgi:hypothetical protein
MRSHDKSLVPSAWCQPPGSFRDAPANVRGVSHFLCLVLVSPDARDVYAEVDRLLAPYCERERGTTRGCYCVPTEADRRARAVADERAGRHEDLMKAFATRKATLVHGPDATLRERGRTNNALYKEVIGPWQAAFRSARKELVSTLMPAADCARCLGRGSVDVVPRASKWDDWVVGGRWAGVLHGKRDVPEGDRESLALNVRPASELVPLGPLSAFAVLTPDGEWHEAGTLLPGGRVVDPVDGWDVRLAAVLEGHREALVVACDCHL